MRDGGQNIGGREATGHSPCPFLGPSTMKNLVWFGFSANMTERQSPAEKTSQVRKLVHGSTIRGDDLDVSGWGEGRFPRPLRKQARISLAAGGIAFRT